MHTEDPNTKVPDENAETIVMMNTYRQPLSTEIKNHRADSQEQKAHSREHREL